MQVVEPNDPDRCQSGGRKGQCRYRRVEPSQYCERHGGNKAVQAAEKQAIRNYRLDRFHQRIGELGSSPDVKSLRDEIGILRMLMETRLNKCKDATDLILQSAAISELVLKIEKLVVSCDRLETRLGFSMDREQLLVFAQQVISIIAANIQDEDTLEIVAEQIIQCTQNSQTSSVPASSDDQSQNVADGQKLIE